MVFGLKISKEYCSQESCQVNFENESVRFSSFPINNSSAVLNPSKESDIKYEKGAICKYSL